MAPEQLEGKEPGARADIFAFGAVLYESLTGRRPFGNGSPAQILASILRSEPEPLSQVVPHVPAALDRIVSRCLAKDPEQRWQTARDLGLELQWIERDPRRPRAEPAAPPPRRGTSARFHLYGAVDLKTVKSDIWALDLGAGRKPTPIVTSDQFDEGQGQLSPSRRWIAYTSDETGQSEVYAQSFGPSGARPFKLQVSSNGGSVPRWRGDTREIFYMAPGGKLMSVPIREGKTLEAAAPEILFQVRMPAGSWRVDYAVTGDGQHFLINVVTGGSESAPITVVFNPAAALRKR